MANLFRNVPFFGFVFLFVFSAVPFENLCSTSSGDVVFWRLAQLSYSDDGGHSEIKVVLINNLKVGSYGGGSEAANALAAPAIAARYTT